MATATIAIFCNANILMTFPFIHSISTLVAPTVRLRVAGAMRGLANYYYELRRYDDALAVSDRMVTFVAKNLPPDGSEIAQSHIDLAGQLLRDRKRPQATAHFEAAEEAAKVCKIRETCDKLQAQAHAMLGLILLGDGEFEKAEAIIKPMVNADKDKLQPELYRMMIKTYADALRSADREPEAKAVEQKLR